MDNDYPVDVTEILRVLATAEVIVFRFLLVSQRLLVDLRADVDHRPLLALVPPVKSAEERFRSLRRLRPGLPAPERITVIHWPKFVRSLETSGIWTAIQERVQVEQAPQAPAADALCELRRLEGREVQHALRGTGYQTLWER